MRSGQEKKGGVKFVDESNFLSLERFFFCVVELLDNRKRLREDA